MPGASAGIRTAFNKENPTELIQQLVKVLEQRGLVEEANLVRKISKAVQKAWADRKVSSSRKTMTQKLVDEVIRLAHDDMSLRDPLLQVVASFAKRVATIGIGDTFESSKIRIHRFRPSVQVWDLTNAGKRGKKVDTFSLHNLDSVDPKVIDRTVGFMAAKDYKGALALAKGVVEKLDVPGYQPKVDAYQLRGVDVTPAGFKPIHIDGRYITVESDYNDFTVTDKEDIANLPRCIPAAGGKRDIKVFYRWVSDNVDKVRNMRFSDIVKSMTREGIKFHEYCSMD